MKTAFEFSLRGKDWWKPFIPFWIVYLAYIALTQSKGFTAMAASNPGAYFAIFFAVLFIFSAAMAAFGIVFLRIFLTKLKIGDRGFDFRGEIGRFLGKVVLGTFLSIITIGFYLPWFCRSIVAYLASETRFGGEEPKFMGKPSKLLVYGLLALVLPVIAVMALVFLVFGFGPDASAQQRPMTIALCVVMFIVIIPYYYLAYRWYVNFSLPNVSLRWKTEFWPSCLFILGQLCLTVVTIGVYWPAAALKLYGYFAERTVLERDGTEIGHLSFEGRIGKGFGLFWGQSLLCLITLGFYIPWGAAKMYGWAIGNSCYVTKD